MPAFLYLLLAHLVADFVLQPYELVKLKARPVGLAIHAGIYGALTALVAAPLFPRWPVVVLALTAAHYLVDRVKVRSHLIHGPASFVVFLADQAAHLIALAAVAGLAGLPRDASLTLGTPAVTGVLYYAVPYVTATFAGAILLYQLALAYRTRRRPEDLLSPGPRVAGYAERGLILTGVLFLAPAFWAVVAAWYAVRLMAGRHQPGRWIEVAASGLVTLPLGVLFRLG